MEPLLHPRSNQKFCDDNCKRKAAYRRKRQAAVEAIVPLPSRIESTLAAYTMWSGQDATKALVLLSTLLKPEQFQMVREQLNGIVRRGRAWEAVRIHKLDRAEAERDYEAFSERTSLPP